MKQALLGCFFLNSCLAGTMATVQCVIPSQTVNYQAPLNTSCQLQQGFNYEADASSTINPGTSLLLTTGASTVGGGTADATGSFDMVFAEPVTLTWQLNLYSNWSSLTYGAGLNLGPIYLDEPAINQLCYRSQGIFIESIPAGDWAFSGTDHSSEAILNLSATLLSETTGVPEPATAGIVLVVGLGLLVKTRKTTRV